MKKTFLIAKDVSKETLYKKLIFFQRKVILSSKIRLPSFRRFWSDQLGRHFSEFCIAGHNRSSHGTEQGDQQGCDRQRSVDDIVQTRTEVIHHAVGLPDNQWEEPAAKEEAGYASDKGSAA